MPISAADARQVQGRFDASIRGRQPPSQEARCAARWPLARPLRLSNRPADLLTFACLLGSARPAAIRAGIPRHVGYPVPTAAPAGSSALLPGSAAMPISYIPIEADPQSTWTTGLSNIANIAAATCVARPRTCLTAAGLVTAGAIATAVGSTLFPSRATLPPVSAVPPISPPMLDADTAARLHEGFRHIEVIAPDTGAAQSLEHGFVQASAACDGDAVCLRAAVARLLQGVSPADQRHLADLVGSAPKGNPVASTLLPGAQAHPLFGPRMLDDLVALVAQLYPVDEARYRQDVDRIVQATCGEPLPDGTSCQQRAGDNASRMEMIHRLFEATGLPTRVLPYQAGEQRAKQFGIPDAARNLLTTNQSPATEQDGPTRVLMLVAHGDMIGNTSSGAYDNASGVACLLHIARTLPADSLPSGTTVQLLVTSNEETGLLGASAFVEQCKAATTCPTLSVNVDLIGRGGHGYVMSGSDTVGRFTLGTSFDQAATRGTVSAEEAAGARLLQDTFAAHGFTRHLDGQAYVVPSDNVAFQRQGLPALGLSQASADEAQQDKAMQDADVAVGEAFRAVDWTVLDTLTLRNDTLDPQEQQQLRAQLDAVDVLNAADDAATRLYKALPTHSKMKVIHSAEDQARILSASDAVAFSTALGAFVQRWASAD